MLFYRDTELGLLCENYAGIAELVEPEDVDALVEGIEVALQRVRPNQVAITYARDNIDGNIVLREFESELLKLYKRS
jgi:colanic acid biosynthesis glycosyl transferase WcaI